MHSVNECPRAHNGECLCIWPVCHAKLKKKGRGRQKVVRVCECVWERAAGGEVQRRGALWCSWAAIFLPWQRLHLPQSHLLPPESAEHSARRVHLDVTSTQLTACCWRCTHKETRTHYPRPRKRHRHVSQTYLRKLVLSASQILCLGLGLFLLSEIKWSIQWRL